MVLGDASRCVHRGGDLAGYLESIQSDENVIPPTIARTEP